MAIDGVGIIDSDSAHDIYNTVVDGWRNHRPLAEITAEVLGWEGDFCFDPLETEIYWTAFAYALWKIGQPDPTVHDHAARIIAGGATEQWLTIDAKAQKQRQRRLDKLAAQLAEPNPRPLRQPAIPKTVKQPLYARGDVLGVALPDGHYGAMILVEVDSSARKVEYNFSVVNLMSSVPITVDEVLAADVSGTEPLPNLPGGGFAASCWTNDKVIAAVATNLTVIGQVDLGSAIMINHAPALTPEQFFQKWDPFWMTKDLVPVATLVALRGPQD